jgi:hypothetical protein
MAQAMELKDTSEALQKKQMLPNNGLTPLVKSFWDSVSALVS